MSRTYFYLCIFNSRLGNNLKKSRFLCAFSHCTNMQSDRISTFLESEHLHLAQATETEHSMRSARPGRGQRTQRRAVSGGQGCAHPHPPQEIPVRRIKTRGSAWAAVRPPSPALSLGAQLHSCWLQNLERGLENAPRLSLETDFPPQRAGDMSMGT